MHLCSFVTPCMFLQSQYEETVQACEIERSLFNQDMAAALHAILEHKEHVTNTLQKVHCRILGMTNEFIAVTI